MVVFGRPKGYRGSYQQWNEDNIGPQVVFEIWSPGNRPAPMIQKFKFYERYGVEEYYLYDPQTLELTGWQRQEEQLEAIEQIDGWISPRLGVRFQLSETGLEMFGPSGEAFMSFVELAQVRRQAEARAIEAEQQAQQAEQLRQQAEQLRQQAEQLRQQAEQQAQQAEQRATETETLLEQERSRSQALESRLREMGIDLNQL